MREANKQLSDAIHAARLALAKKNQLIRVMKRKLDRVNTDNSVLRARVARLELEAEWADVAAWWVAANADL